MAGTMTDLERFRRRLEAAGAEVPADLLEVLFTVGGRLVTALDALLVLDLGDAEPFVAARRLPEDAPR